MDTSKVTMTIRQFVDLMKGHQLAFKINSGNGRLTRLANVRKSIPFDFEFPEAVIIQEKDLTRLYKAIAKANQNKAALAV